MPTTSKYEYLVFTENARLISLALLENKPAPCDLFIIKPPALISYYEKNSKLKKKQKKRDTDKSANNTNEPSEIKFNLEKQDKQRDYDYKVKRIAEIIKFFNFCIVDANDQCTEVIPETVLHHNIPSVSSSSQSTEQSNILLKKSELQQQYHRQFIVLSDYHYIGLYAGLSLPEATQYKFKTKSSHQNYLRGMLKRWVVSIDTGAVLRKYTPDTVIAENETVITHNAIQLRQHNNSSKEALIRAKIQRQGARPTGRKPNDAYLGLFSEFKQHFPCFVIKKGTPITKKLLLQCKRQLGIKKHIEQFPQTYQLVETSQTTTKTTTKKTTTKKRKRSTTEKSALPTARSSKKHQPSRNNSNALRQGIDSHKQNAAIESKSEGPNSLNFRTLMAAIESSLPHRHNPSNIKKDSNSNNSEHSYSTPEQTTNSRPQLNKEDSVELEIGSAAAHTAIRHTNEDQDDSDDASESDASSEDGIELEASQEDLIALLCAQFGSEILQEMVKNGKEVAFSVLSSAVLPHEDKQSKDDNSESIIFALKGEPEDENKNDTNQNSQDTKSKNANEETTKPIRIPSKVLGDRPLSMLLLHNLQPIPLANQRQQPLRAAQSSSRPRLEISDNAFSDVELDLSKLSLTPSSTNNNNNSSTQNENASETSATPTRATNPNSNQSQTTGFGSFFGSRRLQQPPVQDLNSNSNQNEDESNQNRSKQMGNPN